MFEIYFDNDYFLVFLSSKGNEYFLRSRRRFHLGQIQSNRIERILNNDVANYRQALDLITDSMHCVFK